MKLGNTIYEKNETPEALSVGILSMHRVPNHGSFWQAYLLKKMLEDKGCKAEFIDIIPGRRLYDYPHRKFEISKLKYYLCFRSAKYKMFNNFVESELNCPSYPNYSTRYDRIIIGSDEVFNFSQKTSWAFSPQLHGQIDNDHVSSYAASFGASSYDDVEKYGIRDELVSAMSHLEHISVRDENSFYITKKLLPGAEIYRHLDPVLVGDLPIPSRAEVACKYIVIYAYNFRFNDKEYIREIKSFAKKNGYRIYSVGFYQNWVDKNINADPHELLRYFVNADYIITDTFHGTIFSVRCHKKFVTVIRDGALGNRQKLSSLLKGLALEDRILTDHEKLAAQLASDIDYDAVEKILEAERARTEEYLDMCLRGETTGL